MNSWYVFAVYALFTVAFSAFFIISLVRLIISKIKNNNSKKKIISLILSGFLLSCTILFIISHPTYYKYNDMWIKSSSISEVENKYGNFDIGCYHDGKKGKVGYYIYTDKGPIMPDYLDHYYYIEYDEYGKVYNVYDECQPGG